MKHYKSMEFLLNMNVKPSLHKRQAPRTKTKPPWWRLSGDGSGNRYCDTANCSKVYHL